MPKVFCTDTKPLLRHFSSCFCTRSIKTFIVPCKLLPSVILNINLLQVINNLEGKIYLGRAVDWGLSFVACDRGGIACLAVVAVGLRRSSRSSRIYLLCTFLPAARMPLKVLCVLPGME